MWYYCIYTRSLVFIVSVGAQNCIYRWCSNSVGPMWALNKTKYLISSYLRGLLLSKFCQFCISRFLNKKTKCYIQMEMNDLEKYLPFLPSFILHFTQNYKNSNVKITYWQCEHFIVAKWPVSVSVQVLHLAATKRHLPEKVLFIMWSCWLKGCGSKNWH